MAIRMGAISSFFDHHFWDGFRFGALLGTIVGESLVIVLYLVKVL